MLVISEQTWGVRTACTMNDESFASANKAKNVITGYRVTTFGKIVHNLIAAFAKYYELRFFFAVVRLRLDHCFLYGLLRLWRLQLVAKNIKFLQFLKIKCFYCDLVIKVELRIILVKGDKCINICL